MSEKQKNIIPQPPANVNDPEQIAGGEERWEQCPLHDCKRDPNLLYSDFYLRDIRTNRLMCNACAVRVEMGYMAREVARAAEDRFYSGNLASDAILLAVMIVGSLIGNMIAMFIGFFYFAFIIGGAIGAGLAIWARRLSGKKVTRQSHYFGIAGIILGALIAVPLFYTLRLGFFFFDISLYFSFDVLACTAGMVMASWGVFLRRI
jgi:hypothetical protein